MPLIDLNRYSIPKASLDCDVVIVGAGAAGIFLAHELSNSGAKVTLIETGNHAISEARQSLNAVENTGKILGTAHYGRSRAIGGTTRSWGGQSLPFGSLDFRRRDWVRESGWPINEVDLQEHYSIANAFMGIDDLDYKKDIFRFLGRRDLFPEDEQDLNYHFSKWAPQADFYRLYKHFLRSKTTVLFNAQLTRIDLSHRKERACSIEISNFKGKKFELKLSRLVIASGGLETVRILLSNSHQCKGGLGNHSGWLGKCFMEHPCLEVGKIVDADSRTLQQWFAPRIANGRKYSVRISPTTVWQSRNQLLNISASVMFAYENEFDPYQEVRSILRQYKVGSIGRVFSRLPMLVSTLIDCKWGGWMHKPNAVGTVSLMCEQEPLLSSCLTLGTQRDMFGIPYLSVNWDISDATWRTCVSFSRELRDKLAATGLGTLDIRAEVTNAYDDWKHLLSDVNHHMGGARMSADAEGGVVTQFLNVWGIENMFVCSTAVFPTSSHSNPTLTLLALGSRLSRTLLKT